MLPYTARLPVKIRRLPITLLCVMMLLPFPAQVFSQDAPEAQTPGDTVPPDRDAPLPTEERVLELYDLGDKMLSINLGLLIPLFFQAANGSIAGTNLSLGGSGSIRFESFLSSNVTLGGELGGSLSFSPNGRTLIMVPLTARVSYILRRYPFEFPLSFGAGINLTKLDDAFHIDPILKPAVSFYWNYNAEWAFGINLAYSWIPQIYSGGGLVPAEHTRFGNFLDVTLSALYHF
jgi:hypothetical protein